MVTSSRFRQSIGQPEGMRVSNSVIAHMAPPCQVSRRSPQNMGKSGLEREYNDNTPKLVVTGPQLCRPFWSRYDRAEVKRLFAIQRRSKHYRAHQSQKSIKHYRAPQARQTLPGTPIAKLGTLLPRID